MNISAKLVTRNLRNFHQELKSADTVRRKAGEAAVKVEGFRLRHVLKKEIRQGAPGGRKFTPLQVITRGAYRRRPLRGLSKWIYYWVTAGKNGIKNISVGFGGKGYEKYSSQSIMRIARKQQEGFSVSADARRGDHTTHRAFYRHLGVLYNKQGKRSVAQFHFLNQSTTQLFTPARPIIGPFWLAHGREAARNIQSNFVRKMAGDRI